MNSGVAKEHVFSTIQDIVNRKRGKIVPAVALYVKEVLSELSGYAVEDVIKALQDLCREKRIRWGHTINDKYFIPL